MNEQSLGPISPFFVVQNVRRAADYYAECLGFEVRTLIPEDNPFFAIVGRGNVQLFLKEISDSVQSQPNHTLHEWAPWDAYVYSTAQSGLCEEFRSRGANIQKDVHDREDGLTGFEVRDLDGYVLFFGHPK